jgi:uncharacterized protein YjaZ
VLIPTTKIVKMLGLTMETGLNIGEHVKITKQTADFTTKVQKALKSTSLGKQKERLLSNYKIVVLPVIEDASTLSLQTF